MKELATSYIHIHTLLLMPIVTCVCSVSVTVLFLQQADKIQVTDDFKIFEIDYRPRYSTFYCV